MLVLLFGTASAHHSGAEFDKDRVVVIEGTVVDYRWRNPHVYVVVNDSNDFDWMMETDATPIMQRSGWTRDSFALGDAVTVRANPDRRSDKHHGLIRSITGSDGVPMASMNLMRGTNVSNDAVGATTLAGVWTGDRSETGTFWDGVKGHPLTPKGQAAQAAFDETMSPTTNCIAWPTPFFMAANSLYLNAVEIADNVVIIKSEFFDATRIIYLDGRGHPKDGERTNQGHSTGKWENHTLVIDTTLFVEHRAPVPNTGIPSGLDKHVVERLTLSDDGKSVQIEMTVEDLEYFAEPQQLSVTWHHAPHLEMLRVDCDPDVAQQFLQ
jgi:hypothetical protein